MWFAHKWTCNSSLQLVYKNKKNKKIVVYNSIIMRNIVVNYR